MLGYCINCNARNTQENDLVTGFNSAEKETKLWTQKSNFQLSFAM